LAKDLACVLNSGSVNSAVATALAAQKYRPILLHAEVSPQPGSRIRAAYDQQVAHFKPYREHTLPMPFLAAVQPGTSTASIASDPRISQTSAPLMLELLTLLSAGARYASHYGAATIYLGLRVGSQPEELARATEYIQIWNELLQLPCALSELSIEAPLLELDAWQVVDVGMQVNAPFERTWSCMDEGAEPCWACRGCRAREAAFVQAGKPDPMRVVRRV
jgi:7-cyano-7-deazaguanine synthase